MAYHYETQKKRLFTDDGSRLFFAFRDQALVLLEQSGAVRMLELMRLPKGFGCEDSWDLMACADRMVEFEDMREVTGPGVAGQHRVFVTSRL